MCISSQNVLLKKNLLILLIYFLKNYGSNYLNQLIYPKIIYTKYHLHLVICFIASFKNLKDLKYNSSTFSHKNNIK